MTNNEAELIVEKRDDHLAIVTINREKARNAINANVARALDAAVKDLESDDNIWAVILTGKGSIAFCAGADLKEVSEGKVSDLMIPGSGFAGFVHAKRSKPWIAAVENFALAGGCELALSCDMIVATKGGAFGLPEVTRGMIASASGTYRLPRALPKAIAIECILTANRISSDRAAELGMINRLVEPGQALSEALALATEIIANAPIAVRESLAIARASEDSSDAELRILSDEAQARIEKTEDFAEGPLAFVEKRAPNWKGR